MDRLLRAIHHPDKIANASASMIAAAYPNGPKYRLDTRWFTEWQTYFYGSQDQQIHRWISENIKAGAVVLDVGANFGYFTCLMAWLGATVHAFEPIEWLRERIQQNLHLNALEARIVGAAVSDRTGEVVINTPNTSNSNWGTSSIVRPPDPKSGGTVRIPSISLSDYCAKFEKLDFIKMDIEGAELLALSGAAEMFKRFKPSMIMEATSPDQKEIERFLRDLHYEIMDLRGRRLRPGDPWPHDILVKASGC